METTQIKKDIMDACNNNKFVMITHANCMDGNGSVLAVSESLGVKPSDLNVIFIQHGDVNSIDDIHDDLEQFRDKFVLIADFSFKRDIIEAIKKVADRVVVIDHHITAEKELEGMEDFIFDNEESGATLVWRSLEPYKEVPMLLQYIKDRDLWQWKLKDSKLVSKALYDTVGLSDLEKLDIIEDIYSIDWLITTEIIAVHEFVESEIKKIADNAKLTEVKFPIRNDHVIIHTFNNRQNISEVGNILSNNYNAVCQYFIEDDKIIFSLRSSKDNPNHIDVSKVARANGGGGHKHAAGFTKDIMEFDFNTFFKNNIITQ